jgi:hypothetical protein
MRIIGFINNPFTQSDFALYLKDNYEGDNPPTPPVNSDSLERTKSGMPLLKIEFWRNEQFNDLFWQGEYISYVQDDDSDFEKRGCPWSEFMELYESW